MRRKQYQTKRFTIRPLKVSDYPTWFDRYTNGLPKQTKFDFEPRNKKKYNKDFFKLVLKRQKSKADNDTTYIYGIFRDNRVLVGILDVHILVRAELQKANLGYQIFNRYWQQGIASEALKIAIPNFLIDLKLNRLEAVIDTDNFNSIALVKKLGLRSEGIRESYWFQDGDWADQAVFIADRKLFKLKIIKPKLT